MSFKVEDRVKSTSDPQLFEQFRNQKGTITNISSKKTVEIKFDNHNSVTGTNYLIYITQIELLEEEETDPFPLWYKER